MADDKKSLLVGKWLTKSNRSGHHTDEMQHYAAFHLGLRCLEKSEYKRLIQTIGGYHQGLPPDKKEFFKTAKTEISYRQDGEHWEIHVGMEGVQNHRTFRFKLGEPYESASLDGSPMHSIMTAEGDKFIEKHVDQGLQDMELKIVRWIEGEKMIVETNVGPLHMRSVYGRVPDF